MNTEKRLTSTPLTVTFRTASVIALVCLAACGGAPSLSKVDQYVVDACDISRGTEGESKGKWVAPSMENSDDEKPWSAWDDPISKLTEIRDGWQRRVIPATTAAQLDNTFRQLADAIKSMLDTTTLVVDLRETGSSLTSAYDGLREYNSHLATWRTECNATSNRLPK